MGKKLFILSGIADFAPGFFENTAVESGCIQLLNQNGAYAKTGSYTSPSFEAEAFFSLTPSWNADCPPGSSVEMQVRVATDGQWSRWFSFGRWSPYLKSATPAPVQDDIAGAGGETLTLLDGQPAADLLQMRIFLRTEKDAETPQVWLLAACTNAARQAGKEAKASGRVFGAPAYSSENRDPALAGRIAGATALCMMVNRYGRDTLPEEMARLCYDDGQGLYDNLSFLAAAAGAQGFRSYVAYAGLAALQREVWEGRAVGAKVCYRAPTLPGLVQPNDAHAHALPPVLEGAYTGSGGHLVVVHGFARHGGKEIVLMNDPLCPSDGAAQREVPLASFVRIYTGLALFMQKGPAAAGAARPQRKVARLVAAEQGFSLWDGGRRLLPAALPEAWLPATLCYALPDNNTAWAQQAQNAFYYPPLEAGEALRYEKAPEPGGRLTVYLAGSSGQLYVAEHTLPQPVNAQATEGENAPPQAGE